MKLTPLTVLSEAEISQIHEASLEILLDCGVKIGSRKMLDFLAGRGLPVDREHAVARFPRSCVEDALTTIPARFDVFDREAGLRSPSATASRRSPPATTRSSGWTRIPARPAPRPSPMSSSSRASARSWRLST